MSVRPKLVESQTTKPGNSTRVIHDAEKCNSMKNDRKDQAPLWVLPRLQIPLTVRRCHSYRHTFFLRAAPKKR
jgi:hypothetical protein